MASNADLNRLQHFGAVGAQPGPLPYDRCRVGAMANGPHGPFPPTATFFDGDFVGGARLATVASSEHERSLDGHRYDWTS